MRHFLLITSIFILNGCSTEKDCTNELQELNSKNIQMCTETVKELNKKFQKSLNEHNKVCLENINKLGKTCENTIKKVKWKFELEFLVGPKNPAMNRVRKFTKELLSCFDKRCSGKKTRQLCRDGKKYFRDIQNTMERIYDYYKRVPIEKYKDYAKDFINGYIQVKNTYKHYCKMKNK